MPLNINNPYIPGDPYAYDLKWIVSKIRFLQGHLAAHLFEIIIDTPNSAITVKDCSNGAVLSSEDDPVGVYAVCNKFFNTSWQAADLLSLTDADYEYPHITEAPVIKIVNTSGPVYMAYAQISYNGGGKLHLAWQHPSTLATKSLTINASDDFVYANCTFA